MLVIEVGEWRERSLSIQIAVADDGFHVALMLSSATESQGGGNRRTFSPPSIEAMLDSADHLWLFGTTSRSSQHVTVNGTSGKVLHPPGFSLAFYIIDIAHERSGEVRLSGDGDDETIEFDYGDTTE